MFEVGQFVICMDEKMEEGFGPVLTKGRVYKVEKFVSPEDCARLFPDHPAEWEKNGGRMKVKEDKGYWYGRRFEIAESL